MLVFINLLNKMRDIVRILSKMLIEMKLKLFFAEVEGSTKSIYGFEKDKKILDLMDRIEEAL